MSPAEHPCVFWPPSPTSFMAGLRHHHAQSIIKDTHRGCVAGMSYRIQGERISVQGKPRMMYFIHIDGWEYTIRDESSEYPILSFSYLETGARTSPAEKTVSHVQVMGRTLTRGYRIADKTLRVASYLMQRIQDGDVPDVARVLSLYKITPMHPLMPGFVQDSFIQAQRLRKSD